MNSTHLNGAYAELQFELYAMESSWEVAKPIIDAASYDALIRRSPESPWETVQVKHAYYFSNAKSRGGHKYLRANTVRNNGGRKTGRYKDGDFDWLFVYHNEGRWFFPWDLIKKKGSSIIVGSPMYDMYRV